MFRKKTFQYQLYRLLMSMSVITAGTFSASPTVAANELPSSFHSIEQEVNKLWDEDTLPWLKQIEQLGTPNKEQPSLPSSQLPKQQFTLSQKSTGSAKLAKLRVRVIDGRTLSPISGAEVVLIETGTRTVTDKMGYTPYFDAPIIRNPKYFPLVAELHGQLGVIVYKNGYHDSVHLGIRMHDGIDAQTTVWMYKILPGERIEPVLYEVPYHHLWVLELANRFRSKTQPGEGPERP